MAAFAGPGPRPMSGAVHVVGAGIAGLVAALALARAGRAVTLHDAAPTAGGRCRGLPESIGSGLHVLTGADHAALGFLSAIGARTGWVEPEPEGVPVLDLTEGRARRIAPAPLAWRDEALRPPGLTAGAALALLGMALPLADRPVAAALARHPDLLRGWIEPLALATLNTPVAEASSARLGQVLRRLAGRQAGHLLVARTGLGPDLIDPALAALRSAGAVIRLGSRLRAMTTAEGHVTALHFARDSLPVAEGAVLLALPAWEAVRLVPGLKVPGRHAPTVGLHFARDAEGPVRAVLLAGGLAQRVVVRPSGVSVGIAAADAACDEPAEALAPRVWAEVGRAAAAFGLHGDWPEAPPPVRATTDLRATPRHAVGFPPHAPRRPMRNLVLAGDWTWPGLPASVEAAARSGDAAARALL